MAGVARKFRDLPLVRRFESLVTGCARVVGNVIPRRAAERDAVPQTLKVEVRKVSFDAGRGGTRFGEAQISVANLSVDIVERLTISVVLKLDGVGPVYTVEHTCRAHIEQGDFIELTLDLGEVPLEDFTEGVTTEVQVLASRHVNKTLPTYVLPESSTGICAIEDPFMLARDIVVQRIDISVSRTFFGNKGWARVMYVMRNDSGISHHGLSIATRFYAVTGELIGSDESVFDIGALGVSRVVAKVGFKRSGALGASRFEAEVDGFEDIARGASSYRGIDGISARTNERAEVWEGEEVKGALWMDRA